MTIISSVICSRSFSSLKKEGAGCCQQEGERIECFALNMHKSQDHMKISGRKGVPDREKRDDILPLKINLQASRHAAEGLIGLYQEGNAASLVEVSPITALDLRQLPSHFRASIDMHCHAYSYIPP